MENKQSPSKKKLISIQEEKITREVNYDSIAENSSRLPIKPFHLDLEILRKNPTHRQTSQRVLVSIKPRAPAIKTLYIAEKTRFHSGTHRKGSDKSGSRSRLGIGDHSSFTTHYSDVQDDSNIVASLACSIIKQSKSETESEKVTTTDQEEATSISLCSQAEHSSRRVNVYNEKQRSAEKCYVYTQPQVTMNLPRIDGKAEKSKVVPNKVDIATLVVTNPFSEDALLLPASTVYSLHKRINNLERNILKQEMVFRSLDPNFSSSDEDINDAKMRATSESARAGCSYIQQYSHIPETSAFQRYAQQASTVSPSKATTLEKEHNSEQYGRDFTAYDGITARGRRQSASVPSKRDDFPKMAAERVHKIRYKLNPVRDYRLMDTVHYLAQGEFAPRDDGIKLTPSREAVLSDIIWEDVCRTHWPNARLGRRNTQPERFSTRSELQRLIDSLLRERVAHVERRRRRHYRIVKLNHRHESCRPVGKTGDIIVASHKKKENNEDRNVPINEHNAASAMMSDRRRGERNPRKSHKSHDRLTCPETLQNRRFRQDDCAPGPSHAVPRVPGNREPTCCYQTSSPTKPERNAGAIPKTVRRDGKQDLTSASSSICKPHNKNPRLIVKKETSRKKTKEEPNLEQYILLPTLVIRTPSNVRRQKKFSELYHRILNVQLNSEQNWLVGSEGVDRTPNQNPNKKNVGFNINITLSSSAEKINKQQHNQK